MTSENAFDTSVLIVGAGPTGLMAASQLARFGIECIIIDKKDGPEKYSRAIGVQARTLEIYEQMGIVEKMLKHGHPIKHMHLYIRDHLAANIKFGSFGIGLSPYPYILVLNQQITDKELANYFESYEDRKIWWNTTIEGFTQNDLGVTATLRRQNGKRTTVQAKWIIGADGAHSFVREHLPIQYQGGTYKPLFWLADITMKWNEPPNTFVAKFTKHSFIVFFPMGKDTYRLTGVLKDNEDKEELTLAEIKTILEDLDIKAEVSNLTWSSTFKTHHKHVNSFHHQRAFVAGDAAHIHSPAGAQGMNTGLQDSYNLAWKIAYIEKGYAKEKILETYNQERLPIAKQLLQTTDRAFSVITSTKLSKRMIRRYAIPLVAKAISSIPFFKKKFFTTFSQIGISYHDSDLSHNYSSSQKIKAGDRFPYIKLSSDESSFDWFKHTKFTLLVSPKQYKKNKEKIDFVIEQHKDILTLKTHPFDTKNLILVRPDMYVGCVAQKTKDIETYFEKLKK